jgi:hypothetical protein
LWPRLLELSPDPHVDLGDSLAGADADIFTEFARSRYIANLT